MSGQPPGASFIPFMTSVTTDIYERIDKVAQTLETVKQAINESLNGIKESLEKIAKSMDEMIEQSEMNKEMTLQAFADTTNNLIEQIRVIRNEQIEGLKSSETQEVIESVSKTATLLESRMYDIQIALLINGVHALVNAIKTGKVVGIPVPVKEQSTAKAPKSEAKKPDLAAPVPTLSPAAAPTDATKKHFYGRGVRKKTHDEIMAEKKKKEQLFGKYR